MVADEIDAVPVDLVRALEDGDAERAASLHAPGHDPVVFRRQPDGTRKYATDMWNSDGATPTA